MSSKPNEPWWLKITRKAAPLILAGLALSGATWAGHTIHEHVQVAVHFR